MTARPPEEVVSVALVKGYVAKGEKYCWGKLIGYPDYELYQSPAKAMSGVESQRQGSSGRGRTWTISPAPAVIARGTSSALVFCVARRCEPLPLLKAASRPRLSDLLSPWWESWRPRTVVTLDSNWEPCERPSHVWTARSIGGSSPLPWRQSTGNVSLDLAEGTDAWIRTLELILGSVHPGGERAR